MDNLILEGSKTTPSINFNFTTGELLISGESYPENASAFYDKVITWIKNYVAISKSVNLNFKFIYFNTSSSKAILDIIEILDDYHKKGGKVELNWFYEEGDDDIQESGIEFTENLSLPCNLIEYK